MLDYILKKLKLCRAEELDAANKTISAQCDVLGQANARIQVLNEQLEFAHKQSSALGSKNDEYLSDIRTRDEEITALKQELIDEKNRLDRLQDFEVSEARLLEETKASLKVYKDAEAAGYMLILPCKPGATVYWVACGFDTTVKPYVVEFNENLGYAIIELSVRAIITNDNGTMVLMDASQCIENLPSFHIEDFGKCVFTNIDDANSLFAKIVENSTPVKGRRKKSPPKEKAECIETTDSDEKPITVENVVPVEVVEEVVKPSFIEESTEEELIEVGKPQLVEVAEENDAIEVLTNNVEDPVSTMLPQE